MSTSVLRAEGSAAQAPPQADGTTDEASATATATAVGDNLLELIHVMSRFRASVHNAAPGEGDGLLNHLLVEVIKRGPLRSSELAGAVQAEPSTVSRQVATLVARGLLERRADPVDGRASLLHVTTAGTAHWARLVDDRNRHIAALLAGWSPADRRRFAGLLSRFTDDFAGYRDTWFAALTERPHLRSAPGEASA